MIKGSKKMLTIILFVIFLLALTTCVVINLPQFGKLPSGARLEPDTYHAEEMVKEATELHASLIFSVHYGKFALARHSWDEPYRNIEKIRQAGFTVVKGTIGEVVKY